MGFSNMDFSFFGSNNTGCHQFFGRQMSGVRSFCAEKPWDQCQWGPMPVNANIRWKTINSCFCTSSLHLFKSNAHQPRTGPVGFTSFRNKPNLWPEKKTDRPLYCAVLQMTSLGEMASQYSHPRKKKKKTWNSLDSGLRLLPANCLGRCNYWQLCALWPCAWFRGVEQLEATIQGGPLARWAARRDWPQKIITRPHSA